MTSFAGLALFLTIVIMVVVGGKLLLVARKTRGVPELLIGLGFVCDGIGRGIGQLGQRFVWGDAGLVGAWLDGVFFAIVVAGVYALYAGVWQVFGKDRVSGATTCFLGCCIAAVGFGMRIGSGDFLAVDLSNMGSRVFHFARVSVFVWATIEAYTFWRKLRKRVALGLAEPLAAAQIFCWAIAALASVGMALIIGWNELDHQRNPLDHTTSMCLLLVFTFIASSFLWCAFIPPEAMRRRFSPAAA
jgi:hypothetical protein